MNKIFFVSLLALGLVVAACSNGNATPTPFPLATTEPQAGSANAVAPTLAATPVSMNEYILSLIPKCDSVEVLDEAIDFEWPNFQQRIQELEGSDWGYYACNQPYEEAAAFYRANATEPPYLLSETNWVVIPQGSLGVYFHPVRQTWIYLWIVPQAADSDKTYVIAAYSLDQAFRGGECRWMDPFERLVVLDKSEA